MADTFSYKLNYPAKLARAPKAASYQFGDGYEQRVGLGLNPNLQTWTINADMLSLSLAQSIDTFLSTQGAVKAFNWVNPFGVSILVVCRKWDISLDEDEENTFSATFEEVLG